MALFGGEISFPRVFSLFLSSSELTIRCSHLRADRRTLYRVNLCKYLSDTSADFIKVYSSFLRIAIKSGIAETASDRDSVRRRVANHSRNNVPRCITDPPTTRCTCHLSFSLSLSLSRLVVSCSRQPSTSDYRW